MSLKKKKPDFLNGHQKDNKQKLITPVSIQPKDGPCSIESLHAKL